MAKIAFTRHLQAVGPSDLVAYDGATVGQLLEAVAADYPRLKGYVLDDQGRVRKHIAIFVDGQMQPRTQALALPVSESSEVYVFQALSGG
jgi:sulfur-carrier protein